MIAQHNLPAGKTPAVLEKMQTIVGYALRRMLTTNSPLNFVRKLTDTALQMLQPLPPFAMPQEAPARPPYLRRPALYVQTCPRLLSC